MQDTIIQQWVDQIFENKYNNYQEPPKNLEKEEYDDSINIEIGEDDDSDDECDYGDIIMVKDIPFVAPQGMLIPKDLLMNQILPLIDKEMKKLNVTQEDVEEALNQMYDYE